MHVKNDRENPLGELFAFLARIIRRIARSGVERRLQGLLFESGKEKLVLNEICGSGMPGFDFLYCFRLVKLR